MTKLTYRHVTVSKLKVENFARHWPCFGKVRRLQFEFDPHSQLVGLEGDKGMDEKAVLAISQDAQNVGLACELHPACDLWMRGARTGYIVAVDWEHASTVYIVRMDHPQVKRLQRIRCDYLKLAGAPTYLDKSPA